MLIITAPGQGAQTPGFLAPWLEVPGVAEWLRAPPPLAGCDLIRYGTTGDADEIRDTAIAQPLLVAAALAAAGALTGGPPGDVPADAAAGHSVGELAAGVLAGVLTADDAMRLVRVRGAAMAAGPGGGAGGGADRDDRRAGRRRGGSTGRHRPARPDPGEHQRGGANRGRRGDRGPGGLRGRPSGWRTAAPA